LQAEAGIEDEIEIVGGDLEESKTPEDGRYDATWNGFVI